MPNLSQSGVRRELYNPFPGAPLVNASEVRGPFYIVNAYRLTTKNGINPGPRIMLTLKCRDVQVFTDDGEEVRAIACMVSLSQEREAAADYFQTNRAPIGPVGFLPVPSKSGNPYMAFRDWTPELEAEIASQVALPDADDDLEELPF